jgi:putative membrane protein
MRTISYAMMLGAASLALAGCGKKDDAPAATDSNLAIADNQIAAAGNAAAPAFSPGQAFANAAAASDAFEIATSQLALANSSSAAVKKFAQHMIDAHSRSTAKLKTAAAGATPAIVPDPALTLEQQAALDAMKGKSGAEFDQAYVAAQTDGHQKTLDALRGYATSGDSPALKAFAAEIAPTVAAHLNLAKSLKP